MKLKGPWKVRALLKQSRLEPFGLKWAEAVRKDLRIVETCGPRECLRQSTANDRLSGAHAADPSKLVAQLMDYK